MEESWAVVELMGHVKLVGRLTEEERFGVKMGRLDIPQPPNSGCLACKGTGINPAGTVEDAHPCTMPCCNQFVTQWFSGGSVYRITVVTERVARQLARRQDAAPVRAWDFPQLTTAAGIADDGEEDLP